MTKSPLKSKTIWGLIIIALPQLFNAFGIEIFNEAEAQEVSEAFATIFGFALAVWGRITAKVPLKVLPDADDESIKTLVLCGLLALCVFTQAACASLTPEQRSALVERLVKGVSTLALSIIAHEVGENNPDLKPILLGLSQTITFAAAETPPVEVVLAQVDTYLTEQVSDPYYQAVLRNSLSEALHAYGEMRRLAPNDPRLTEALQKIALALSMAGDPSRTQGQTAAQCLGLNVFALSPR